MTNLERAAGRLHLPAGKTKDLSGVQIQGLYVSDMIAHNNDREHDIFQIAGEHRALDDLLGRFLGAAHANVPDAAREALAAFDDELRRHMAFEEEEILPRLAGRKLVAIESEIDPIHYERSYYLEPDEFLASRN